MTRISEAYLSFDGDSRAWVKRNDASSRREVRLHLADHKIATAFGRCLPPDLADLVDVAMAAYLTDRVVRRRSEDLSQYELGWKRKLTIELPVRLPQRWLRPEIREALHECLGFLTEDEWRFVFVQRQREGRTSERQGSLFGGGLVPPVQIALFSGGLDSLAGTAVALRDQAAGSLILVSSATSPRLQWTLRALTRDVRKAAVRDVRALVLPLGLRQSKAQYNANERSQRTRGFLYGILGAVAAAMAGADEVAFYENGIGAINLPYTPAQLGTHSTRATNPVALARLAGLIELFTEKKINLRLPQLFSTKGEMCAELAGSALRATVSRTVTCDSFPLRHKRASQCGVCSSCLLRRQALYAGGLREEDPGALYFYDVVDRPGELLDKRWNSFRDMLGQVDTFRRALGSARPWDALAGEYPMLREVAWTLEGQGVAPGPLGVQKALMDLVARYCSEWDRFPARPPGWRFGMPDYTADWRLRHAC